ncbi:MAG: non-canonical purine NTP pyrophosphatase [Nanoarchaeota archaeon]|nr:non-canonical purine NTP pyrophosphatase [Nanoarchaeota archaeon]
MILTFVTGNKRKFENARVFWERKNIKIEQNAMETPEIQSHKAEEVAKFSAQFAANKLGKPAMKVDVGFYIDALKGFPGPFVKYINQWLKPENILKMMENKENRTCYFDDVVVLSFPNGKDIVCSYKTQGTISHEVKGKNGWGADKIFIPKGATKTLAQMTDEERRDIWENRHWKLLAKKLKECKI